MEQINIRPGHIARHTPQGAGSQGRGAAIIDIAQDLLLRHLSQIGLMDRLAFKGGTALRKLYAGNAGRFSTDLDFSVVNINDNLDDVTADLFGAIDGLMLGPFTYGMTARRGKWSITYTHTFADSMYPLSSKIDLNPPPWLVPDKRGWIPLPIHKQYGDPQLPELPVVRLEENIAEKIARLNRTTTARDMYDLSWIITTSTISRTLDIGLIRLLAVLKIWVDANGVRAGNTLWKQGHQGMPFDPQRWLRRRNDSDFDMNDIGTLVVPPPTLDELTDNISWGYAFLLDLSADELTVADTKGQDRSLVLQMLRDLPGDRLKEVGLY